MAGYLATQSVNADRLNDIAEALLTAVFESEGRVAANLLEERGANVNGVRVGRLLNAGGEVDAIAHKIVVFYQHVSKMQTKAHTQWALVALSSQQQPRPNAHGASYCVYRTCKFDEHRIAHRLEQTAIAFGNFGVDHVAAVGEPLSGPVLIGFHQVRIADYIRWGNRPAACG